NVDPHFCELRRFLSVFLFQEMRRLLADYADDIARMTEDAEPLPDDDLVVPAAERSEPEEAFLVDVGDDEPDLVDVPGKEDFWRRGIVRRRFDPGKGVAEHVVHDLIGEGLRFLSPNASGQLLVS